MGQTDFDFGHNVVHDDSPPTYAQACMGLMVCPHCGKAAICGDVASHVATSDTEKNTMDMNSHYDNDAKKGGGKYKRRPFLKSTDISAKGSKAKIIDFREAPKQMEYSDFLMDLTIGSKEYTWGLRSKSVTLNMLIDELGKRTEKWIGKTVKLVRAGAKGQYINLG